MCDPTTYVQLTNLVEIEILKQMQTQNCFTALDISNKLKADRYAFRHRQVAEVVRDIYCTGAMDSYGYQRDMITVLTDGGAGTTQTYVYFPPNASPNDYHTRCQSALPPVPTDQARDLSDSVSSDP